MLKQMGFKIQFKIPRAEVKLIDVIKPCDDASELVADNKLNKPLALISGSWKRKAIVHCPS